MRSLVSSLLVLVVGACFSADVRAQEKKDNVAPAGFTAIFNGKDLTGWKGLVSNQRDRKKLTPEQLAEQTKKVEEVIKAHWSVTDGVLHYDGKGTSLCSDKDYGDFELWIDWKIAPKGDSGLYVRGTPQIQIWDPALRNIGSGGLFNNQKKENPSNPLTKADKPVGEWNTFFIKMVGEKVSVTLNGQLVVDNVTLENYWERYKPVYATGPIELQHHGDPLWFKNIYVRELTK